MGRKQTLLISTVQSMWKDSWLLPGPLTCICAHSIFFAPAKKKKNNPDLFNVFENTSEFLTYESSRQNDKGS